MKWQLSWKQKMLLCPFLLPTIVNCLWCWKLPSEPRTKQVKWNQNIFIIYNAIAWPQKVIVGIKVKWEGRPSHMIHVNAWLHGFDYDKLQILTSPPKWSTCALRMEPETDTAERDDITIHVPRDMQYSFKSQQMLQFYFLVLAYWMENLKWSPTLWWKETIMSPKINDND